MFFHRWLRACRDRPRLVRWLRALSCAIGSVAATALLVGAASFAGYYAAPSADRLAALPSGPPARSEARGARATVVLIGDTHFGESYRDARRSDLLDRFGYAHAFRPLSSLTRSATLAVANLETPLTSTHVPFPRPGTSYSHWGDPTRSAQALQEMNVRVVSLANNHIMDQQDGGLADTRRALAPFGIDAVGAGQDWIDAARPAVHEIDLEGRTIRIAILPSFERDWRDLTLGRYAGYGYAGAYGPTPAVEAERIAALVRAHPDLFVVAFPHWGDNYAWRTDAQAESGRAMLEAGARIVIGHGAHRLQEIERHEDRWLLYGIGNGVFLSQGRYAKLDSPPWSLAVALDFEARADSVAVSARLYVVASDNSTTNYQPRIVDGEPFDQAMELWLGRSEQASGDGDLRSRVTVESDSFGPHARIVLGHHGSAGLR